MGDTRADALRQLPAVGALVDSPELAPLVARYGRIVVLEATRAAIAEARAKIREDGDRPAPPVGAREVERAATQLATPRLRRVINATGVVIHTNLGRVPLAPAAIDAVADVSRGYSTLEFDLDTGQRGSRHDHVRGLVANLLGAEDGLAVNNCAGAVLLMLAALCRGREVIVARGELVEIGGGFRVPDVMRESGATLVEVGTTNRVHVRDYDAAIGPSTAAILHVHRSNFAIVGFTAEPGIPKLAALAKDRGIPLLADMGSGLLAADDTFGGSAPVIGEEPRPARAIEDGAGAVAFSGDKLLGGPQAGIVAGREVLLAPMRRHPLARALRADKMTLAALEATLRLHRDGRAREVPAVAMLGQDRDALLRKAERAREAIAQAAQGLRLDVIENEALVGGGALPLARLPTQLVLAGEPGRQARELSVRLRRGMPPVITRIVQDRVAIDVRTIADDEIDLVARAAGVAFSEITNPEVY